MQKHQFSFWKNLDDLKCGEKLSGPGPNNSKAIKEDLEHVTTGTRGVLFMHARMAV